MHAEENTRNGKIAMHLFDFSPDWPIFCTQTTLKAKLRKLWQKKTDRFGENTHTRKSSSHWTSSHGSTSNETFTEENWLVWEKNTMLDLMRTLQMTKWRRCEDKPGSILYHWQIQTNTDKPDSIFQTTVAKAAKIKKIIKKGVSIYFNFHHSD